MIITIDGPAASGKSSAAQALAQKLGFYYINTGFLYRAVTYCLSALHDYKREDLKAVNKADLAVCLDPQRLIYSYNSETGPRVAYDGQDITSHLKDLEIDVRVALISPQPDVRHALCHFQRSVAQTKNIVVDGRDLGSVVFPYADYKFYLTASLSVRAARWQKDQQKRGNIFTLQEAEECLNDRDMHDSSRLYSPAVMATDAITIDSSDLNFKEMLDQFLTRITL